ncbi:MAG: RluA family pseudouridine synthase [bacterium]
MFIEKKELIIELEIMTEKVVSITCSEPSFNPERLDKYLLGHFATYSRTYFQGLISKNLVLVNGKVMSKSSYLVQSGDQISFSFIMPALYDIAPQDVTFQVIAIEKDFLVINKPAGLVVHDAPSNKGQPTLVSGLLHQFPEFQKFGDQAQRPGIVHRLDKDTSGIILVARNFEAQIAISKMFKDRKIHKTYLAVVKGHPEAKGKIDTFIGRHPVLRHKMACVNNSQTPESTRNRSMGVLRGALTFYETLKYYEQDSLIAASPVTGRTHQIRAHCAFIGHGILGDKVYGHVSGHISRQALHAWKISFELNGKQYAYQADVPEDFLCLLKALHAQNLQPK